MARFDVVGGLETILMGLDVVIMAVRGPCLSVCRLFCFCSDVVVQGIQFDRRVSINNHRPTVTRRKGSAYHRDRRIHSRELNWFRRVLSADSVTSQRPSLDVERLMRSLIRLVVLVSLARAVDGVIGWRRDIVSAVRLLPRGFLLTSSRE